MAMAMKSEKKSQKPVSLTANPTSKPEAVICNIELKSLLKEPDQTNPPRASLVRDCNRALAVARDQAEQMTLNATRTARRQAPEIKADTKVSLESITNDPTAPPEFKEEVQKTNRVIKKLRDKMKQAAGKQLSKKQTAALYDYMIMCMDTMKSTVMVAKAELTGDGDGDGDDGDSDGDGDDGDDDDGDGDDGDGDGDGDGVNQEKWYHRFLQWLYDNVNEIWNTVKELKPLSRLASLWESFKEWVKSLFSAKKSTPEDGAVEPANQV